MRQYFPEIIERGRELAGAYGSQPGERHGRFVVRCEATNAQLLIIACSAETDRADRPGFLAAAWDHVSVSAKGRCPTWAEMAWVKDQFFDPEECVIEFHPPKSRYVNNHPFVLHLWRPLGVDIPMPPLEAV